MPQTIYDKIWNDHLVHQQEDGTSLLFVDRHLIHEVTSPQAFEGLRNSNRKVRQPSLTLAVADHNVPTTDRSVPITDEDSKIQIETLEKNCAEFGINLFGMNDKRQGIVHIIGPEQGFTQPGTIIVCGDSHTATHGAFGALAFGIGTSEVEHVLATQTLVQKKSKNFRINVNGSLPVGVTSKDVILQIIGKIGTAGGTGYVIEYAGNLISNLSVEQRMTICNMTIEGGARAGLIEPDEKVFNYLKGKPMSPKNSNWDKALEYWSKLKSDGDAVFDKINKAKNTTTKRYRKNVDEAYDLLDQFAMFINDGVKLKEVSKDIKQLDYFIAMESNTKVYERSITIMDGLFDKLSEISGMDEFLNSVDDLLSMVDSDELDPMAIRTKSKEVVELFNKEVSWRANAKENLMPKLEEYNNAIKETIGLRLQSKLTKEQAIYVSKCNSIHRDISLNF